MQEELNILIGSLMMEGLDYEDALDFILECDDYEVGLMYENTLNEVAGFGGRVDPFSGIYTGRKGYGSGKNVKRHEGTASKMQYPPLAKAASKYAQNELRSSDEKYSPEERKRFKRRANKQANWIHSLDTNVMDKYGKF